MSEHLCSRCRGGGEGMIAPDGQTVELVVCTLCFGSGLERVRKQKPPTPEGLQNALESAVEAVHELVSRTR